MKNKTLIGIFVIFLVLTTAFAQVDTLRLDVDLAIELALKNNNAVQLAKAKLQEASAGKGAALGSFLPQISASGTYYRMTPNKFGDIELGSADNYTLRGTAQQTFLTWGKLINAYRIAGLSFNIEQEAFRQAQAQTKVQATEGFYGALLARKMEELMKESYDQLKRHVNQVQALYDNGLARKLDLMRAKVGLTNMQVQLSQIENGSKLALASLLTTLGLKPETPIALSGDLEFSPWNVDYNQALDAAWTKRPELLQLRKTAQIADLATRIALTANLPTAFAQFNYDYKKPLGFEPKWGSDWNLTVGLTMPIFTGLTNWHKLIQAQAQQRQARIGVAMLEDGVRLEIQALVNTLNQEIENIKNQKENVDVAEEALKIAETSYQNGLITNLEYMDTQLALLQSRVSYLNSLTNYKIAKAKLQKAMGEF